MYVVDRDASSFSRQLVTKFEASPYFTLTQASSSYNLALQEVEKDKADIIVEIPDGFEKSLLRENYTKISVAVNAINGSKAGVANNYASSVINDFTQQINITESTFGLSPGSSIDITFSNWFNPYLDYKTFMVPGILVILVTMIGAFLSGMNIVKEKEIGTIEQLNVTPIKKTSFYYRKAVTFLGYCLI